MIDGALSPDVVLGLHRATHATLQVLAARLAGLDLPASEINVLATLAGHRPLTVGALATATATRPTTLTSVLDRLARRGYVTREGDPAHRRSFLISLTPAGAGGRDRIGGRADLEQAALRASARPSGPASSPSSTRCRRFPRDPGPQPAPAPQAPAPCPSARPARGPAPARAFRPPGGTGRTCRHPGRKTLPPGGAFRHRQHIHLAFLAVQRHGAPRAPEVVARWIGHIAAYERAPQKFNATVTRAWTELVAYHVAAPLPWH